MPSSPRSFAIRPAPTSAARGAEPCSKTLIPVTLPSARPSPRPNGSRSRIRTVPENIRTYAVFAARSALHLEDRAGDRSVGIAPARRQQLPDPGDQGVHPGPGDRRAEVHGMHQRPPGLRRQLIAEPVVREHRAVLDVRGQQRVVVVGEKLGQPVGEAGVGAVVRSTAGITAARSVDRSHGDHGRGQLLGDVPQDGAAPRTAAVDLVHEDERGNAQAPQCPHQHAGLRLYALHRGDDQHGAVEHAQYPFHLGDEVRVAGGVDQIDRGVVDGERDDGGLDRDAALSFERQGIGPGAALVDAADLVDDTGGVEQPLGQARLTGVDMRQNSQIQRVHETPCPQDR